MKRALSTGQFAKYCGVGHRTVLRWIKVGFIDAFQIPGRGDNRIPLEEALRFLEEHEQEQLRESCHATLH
ncbi:MAG: helix-turn-helix domain-containing protein [Candidatus Pacebacteria bacterium]|nr:helix-turn-helix domain-containing protein [Candidatus Paceibacterota bacterium]